MATKKVIITLAVEVEYDDREHAYSDLEENLKGRITAFLYPGGIEVKKVETASIERNS